MQGAVLLILLAGCLNFLPLLLGYRFRKAKRYLFQILRRGDVRRILPPRDVDTVFDARKLGQPFLAEAEGLAQWFDLAWAD